jgi:cobalamin biosynthesis Mg chelatase CobN
MPKVNKPGGDKPTTGKTQPAHKEAPKITLAQTPNSGSTQAAPVRGKQSGKNRRPTIGGTAITGAKSTRPKEMSTSQTPNAEQQAETYSRDMRRRMQHMGTGPYSEPAPVPARKKAQKRIEERKKRQAEVKKNVISKGPSTDIKLGRRNTYFVLGALAFVVLVIVIAIIVRR